MLWKCIECGNVVQTKENDPPRRIKKYKNNDHVCNDWEKDKSKPHSFASTDEYLECEDIGPVSEKEAKKIEDELKKRRIRKLKKGFVKT